jgi:hypothetical protein
MFEEAGSAIGAGDPREHQKRSLQEIISRGLLGLGPNRLNFYMERSTWEEMEAALQGIGRLQKRGHIATLCDFNLVPEALE